MKPLLPTLKERKRYIVYQIITAKPMTLDDTALLQRLKELLGVFGTAEVGLLSIQYNPTTQTGVMRVSNTTTNKVKAALTMITHLKKTKVAIRTLGVSGILKKTARFTGGETCNQCNIK
ncbi:MAG: hypothetical protein OXR66_02345 [Candidatus Woesearchaeota archaeon]|nr:hypothetical protein [Candidatus Woesearchaeota archaeon]